MASLKRRKWKTAERKYSHSVSWISPTIKSLFHPLAVYSVHVSAPRNSEDTIHPPLVNLLNQRKAKLSNFKEPRKLKTASHYYQVKYDILEKAKLEHSCKTSGYQRLWRMQGLTGGTQKTHIMMHLLKPRECAALERTPMWTMDFGWVCCYRWFMESDKYTTWRQEAAVGEPIGREGVYGNCFFHLVCCEPKTAPRKKPIHLKILHHLNFTNHATGTFTCLYEV